MNLPTPLHATSLPAALLLAGGASVASANLVLPTLWTPGDPGSTAQQWDLFFDQQTNPPLTLDLNPNGTANAYDANFPASSSFVTGSGNIYSFAGAVAPAADVPHFGQAGGAFTTVLVNVIAGGEVLDAPAATLSDGTNVFSPDTLVLTDETDFGGGGFGGARQAFFYQFNVPGSADNYTFLAEPSGTSVSFIGLRVDTFTSDSPAIEPAPEPFAIPGDANVDGRVDLADFGILRANFGSTVVDFRRADFDSNGVVNLADFGILRANFGSSASADLAVLDAFEASVIPEPGVVPLAVAAAGIGLLMARQRRGGRA